MEILYAFCREVDDVADEESQPVEFRKNQLLLWRQDLDLVFDSNPNAVPHFSVNRELKSIIPHFDLKKDDFLALLDGVESDLFQSRLQTQEDLELYCYRVASAVGLLSIPIFGFSHPSTRDYAIHLGKALQITNILRDIKTDAELGRIYLPIDDLKKFNVSEKQILDGNFDQNLQNLASHYSDIARHYYSLARKSLHKEDQKSMIAAELMGAVYWNILLKLSKRNFNLWDGNPRTKLSKPHKISLIFKTWFNLNFNPNKPNYS